MNKSVKLNPGLLRVLPIIFGLLCVVAVYFVVKWATANVLATTTVYADVAEYAAELAPNDARTHYTVAVLRERSFIAGDLPKALAEYEKAVSCSPNDWRLWFDLGKARIRTGDDEGAEKALRKALELAPNYSALHWSLGNLLLRGGNTEEAFVEIRKAVENDSQYANPAVTTVWQFFDGDVSLISQKIGDSPQIKSALAVFLAKQNRFDEAFKLWNELPGSDKTTVYKENGENLLQALLNAKRFRDALSLRTQIDSSNAEKFKIGQISNGGFEAAVSATGADIFDWKIDDGIQPQIGFDDQQKHGDNRSLVIVFNSPGGKDFRNVQQMIAVESSQKYKLEIFTRSDLKSSATVAWEIIDAADNKVLASTAAVSNNSEWTPLSAEFTTAPTTQAVILRLAQATCPTTLCPISGKVWFDDFSLRKSE